MRWVQMGLKCWNVSSEPRSSLPVIECGAVWGIFAGVCQTWDTSHAPSEGRKHDLRLSDNQSEARDGHFWPIRGKVVWDLRNMNQQGEKRKRKKTVWSSFFSILDYWVYLLSWEPWMGLELPFFAVILPTAADQSLDIWWQKTAEKSTNKFAPITPLHEPQWRLLCSINCVWDFVRLKIYSSIVWISIDFDASVIIAFICSLYFVRLSTLQQLLMIDTLEACKNCQTQA